MQSDFWFGLNKIIKEKISVKSITIVAVLFFLIFLSSWSLLIPGLGTGHDTNHSARIYEMVRGLQEGQFPVIWSQNFGYGFGMPLFEFYAPLPFYTGAVFYLVGLDLNTSVELMMLLANVITILAAYFLGKELFAKTPAALAVAAVTGLAPYRAVDLFVRTAVSETWAIGFFVVLLWGLTRIVFGRKYALVVTVAGGLGLILSHNLSTLMMTPFAALYFLVLDILHKPKLSMLIRQILLAALAGVMCLLLSAFYFAPALLEKNYTQVDQFVINSYYDFNQHFLYLRQFVKPWGIWEFGGSGWGPDDEMSYFLGFGQLFIIAISLVVIVGMLWQIQKNRKIKQSYLWHVFLLAMFLLSLFLTLEKTKFIWEHISIFKYFQFPWRFLAVSLVFNGLLAGSVIKFLDRKWGLVVGLVLMVWLAGVNTRYFQSEKYYFHADEYRAFPTFIRKEGSKVLFDYLPKGIDFVYKIGFYVDVVPGLTDIEAPATGLLPSYVLDKSKIQLKNRKILFQVISDQSINKKLVVNADQAQSLSVNVADYPGWQVFVNDEVVPHQTGLHGLITFQIPAGQSQIELKLIDTPVRFLAKVVSLVSLFVVVLIVILGQAKKFWFTKSLKRASRPERKPAAKSAASTSRSRPLSGW